MAVPAAPNGQSVTGQQDAAAVVGLQQHYSHFILSLVNLDRTNFNPNPLPLHFYMMWSKILIIQKNNLHIYLVLRLPIWWKV